MNARRPLKFRLAALAFCTAWAPSALAQAGDLVVAEAVNNVVKMGETFSDQVKFKLTVVNPKDRPIAGIVARITPFKDANLVAAKAVLDNGEATSQPFALAAHASHELDIDVALPNTGSHSARLWLAAGGDASFVTLQVTRAQKTSSLAIGNLNPIAIDAPLRGTTGSGPQSVPVTESTGVDGVLPVPRLQAVLYRPNDKVAIAAPGIELASGEPTPVKGGSSTAIPLALNGFAKAGRYEATLQFATPASAPVSRTMLVYVREGWLVAAFWIALGVGLAFALRIYATVLAPRLALQSRVGLLFQQLRALGSESAGDLVAVAVTDGMSVALAARWDHLAPTARLTPADLDLHESKIPLLQNWLRLRRSLPTGLPTATQDLAAKALSLAQTVLENPAASAQDVANQTSALGALPGTLDQSAFDELRRAVSDLQAELEKGTDARQRALHAEVTRLAATLPRAALSMRAWQEDFIHLRKQYADVLLEGLLQLLKALPSTPVAAALTQANAEEARALLHEALAAEGADIKVARYRQAFAMIARPVALAVLAEANTAATAPGANAMLWQNLRTNSQALLTAISARPSTATLADLTQLLSDRQAPALVAASTLKAAPALRSGPSAQPSSMLPAVLAGLGASAGSGLLDFTMETPCAALLARRDVLDKVRRRERLLGGVALLLISLVAIGLGLKTQWADDWAWGGGTAYLVAFLWGAGVSGFSYDGVKNLLAKLVQ